MDAAGSTASGQDAAPGALGVATSSLLTHLLDTPGKTESEKEANRNLLLTLVARISEGMGTDTTTATASAAAALDNNYFPGGALHLLDKPQELFRIKPGNRGNGSIQGTVREWLTNSALDGTSKQALLDTLAGILGDLQTRNIDLRSLSIKDLDNLVSGKTTGGVEERYQNWLTGGGFNLNDTAERKRIVLNFVGGTSGVFWRPGCEGTLVGSWTILGPFENKEGENLAIRLKYAMLRSA